MAKKKLFTKVPMVFSSYRLTSTDNELFKAAAAKDGVSQSEFLRQAIREKRQKSTTPEFSNGDYKFYFIVLDALRYRWLRDAYYKQQGTFPYSKYNTAITGQLLKGEDLKDLDVYVDRHIDGDKKSKKIKKDL